jgi:GT2 family glycosyltransferase
MRPLVTVNILSFNRKDELRTTLAKVHAQAHAEIEVIVVDNNSSDGSVDMVKHEFPGVRVISLAANVGIAGWNEGFKAAAGDYILVLDDDSYPDTDAISRCIAVMEENPRCGVVACRIVNTQTQAIANYLRIDGVPYEFIGFGALLRRTMLERVGYFSAVLFLYLHELEFSIRMVDAGYVVVDCADAVVFHAVSVKNRRIGRGNPIDKRKIFYDVRNLIYILISYFGLKHVFMKTVRIAAGRLYVGMRRGCFWTVVHGLAAGLALAAGGSGKHARVSAETQKKYLYGRFGGGFFFEYSSYGNPRPKWLTLGTHKRSS